MATSFVLPLYPLDGQVLLPGEELRVPAEADGSRSVLSHSRGFGGAVVASLADGESVHEIAVTAMVTESDAGDLSLHGISRCRLLALVSDEVPMVRAERLPEPPGRTTHSERLARLLLSRYSRLCAQLGRTFVAPPDRGGLTALTWRVTADLGLSAEQQQGFLNVPDALTRGRLLLVAVRDLERRERFLRPWAHLRQGSALN